MSFKQWISSIAAFAALGLGAGHASAQLTYGTLDNFDVINDTGGECHGFEIELEGVHPEDVPYTFGAPYQRYGDPLIITTATGVILRYVAAYDPVTMTWSATTPYSAPPYLPTQGHSCWTGGVANPADYYNCGCDHFGASLNVTATKTTYRWLVETSPGVLEPFGGGVQLPAPTWNVIQPPPPNPGDPLPPPLVEVALEPPPPGPYEFGDAQWVKMFVTELETEVDADDLDSMVIDHPLDDIVPHDEVEIEIEWFLLQASTGNPGEQVFGGAEAGANSEAVTRRFEYYAYVGEYDPESHEALCDNAEICPEAIGEIIGAHNAAVNLAGAAVVPASGRAVGDFDNSGCTELQDFLFLLDFWQTVVDGTAIDVQDFLNLLDNWHLGETCPA